jgi:hypothetical protein
MKGIVLPVMFVGMVIYLLVSSIQIFRSTGKVHYRWFKYEVEDYDNNGPSLDEQIATVNAELQKWGEQYDPRLESDTAQGIYDKIKVLEFLKDKGLAYKDVKEGGLLDEAGRTRDAYVAGMEKKILLVNIIVSLILVCVISVSEAASGALTFNSMLRSRKQVIKDNFFCGLAVLGAFFLMELLIVAGIELDFDPGAKYYLYFKFGHISLLPMWIELLLMLLSCGFKSLLYYVLVFAIGQFVTNQAGFLCVAGLVCAVLYRVPELFMRSSLYVPYTIEVLNWYWIEDPPYLIFAVKIAKAAVAALVFIAAVIYGMRRNIKKT